jgi:uncharacterized membrane protein
MNEQTVAAPSAQSRRRSAFDVLAWAGPLVALAVLIVFLSNTQWYSMFKAIHVLAAIVWLGGGAMITVLALRAKRANDNMELLRIGKQAEWLSTRVFVPASLVVLAFGFVLVHKGHWGYGHFWVIFGLAAWAASFVVGATFLGPESGRLAKLIEAKGPEDPEVLARLERILAVARTDVALIFLIAADMVAKPFLT